MLKKRNYFNLFNLKSSAVLLCALLCEESRVCPYLNSVLKRLQNSELSPCGLLYEAVSNSDIVATV